MTEKALRRIRDAEEKALHAVEKAEKDIALAVKSAEEESKKKRDTELFKLKKEYEEKQRIEGEKARKEAERIRAEGSIKLVEIRRLAEENRQKAVDFVVSRLFEGE